MLIIFLTQVLIRHLWKLKRVVFLHWCLTFVSLLPFNVKPTLSTNNRLVDFWTKIFGQIPSRPKCLISAEWNDRVTSGRYKWHHAILSIDIPPTDILSTVFASTVCVVSEFCSNLNISRAMFRCSKHRDIAIIVYT